MKKQKHTIKAVIFDLDGLIVDTELINSQSLEKLLIEYGIKPQPNTNGLLHIVGASGNQSFLDFMKKYNITEDLAIVKKRKRAIFEELLSEKLTPFPGFINLLHVLKTNNIKIALASNRYEKFIHLILENLAVKETFDVIVGPSEKRRHKPYPDIYLDTAKELGVIPEDCIVLEDSAIGIESAKAAGMKIIAVPNKYTKDHDLSKAELITNSLENVTIAMLNTL